MKRLLNILPWIALLFIGAISLPKIAFTQPEHPHIRAAIAELRESRRELDTAAHDFCGHKRDAIRKVDEAIHQLELAAACAR